MPTVLRYFNNSEVSLVAVFTVFAYSRHTGLGCVSLAQGWSCGELASTKREET